MGGKVAVPGWLDALREEAEGLLAADEGVALLSQSPATEPLDCDHELQVRHTELQLQNQQLRRAETQLQQALNRYESLFHALPLPAMVVDTRGIVHRGNERAAAVFGFRSVAQFENHSLLRLIAIADRSRLMVELAKRPEKPLQTLRHVWIQGSDHSDAVEVDLHLEPLGIDYHVDRHVLITMVDQTEHYGQQRQAELLGKVVDDMGLRVAAFDRSGRCLYANRDSRNEAGLGEQEIVGLRRSAWMPPEQAKREEQSDAQVLLTKRRLEESLDRTDRDGRERVVQQIRFPLLNDDLDCVAVGECVVDVTSVRDRDRRMEMAMQAYALSRDGIVMTDGDNRIVSVNPAFSRLTGYSVEEVRGKDPKILASGRHDKSFYRAMWRDIHDGGWEGEIWNRRKSGDIYPEWLSISPVRDPDGRITSYVAVFSDITARKAAEEEIANLALYDKLTGLANRQLLADRVGHAIHAAARAQQNFALVFFDLDHFKQVNDVHGHGVGDRLLQQVSRRAKRLTRESDTLSRLGGDEFVLVLESDQGEDLCQRLQDLQQEISRPYQIEGHQLTISASLGVALYPKDGDNYEDLLGHADAAMYEAKDGGRSQVSFYSSALSNRNRRRIAVDEALRAALSGGELNMVYQPQIAIADGRPVGFEALMRWRSSQFGDVSPAEFIPVAERTALINQIGAWGLGQAFNAVVPLCLAMPGIQVAVNLSVRQLYASDLLDVVDAALDASGVDPAAIEIEFTESMLMHEVDQAMKVMEALKSRGFSLAIDDFGTGYSSLSYLNWMPVDKLKIDRRFIHSIGKDQQSDQVCRTIISLADSLDIRVVAEGIEEQSQLCFLKEARCEVGQGFLFARPMAEGDLLAWLDSWTGLDTAPCHADSAKGPKAVEA
jgi:diguanylate cyclase (GGDEF)-like protein/PAS domain S-box-containing protein